jgi:ParB family transcriptional regulator, chromosome partitioning protein
MPQLVQKPLSWFKRNPKQPRKLPENDADLTPAQSGELTALGESLKAKQLLPVLCQPDGTIIAGERRYRAAKIVGLATLEVKIADEPLTDSQVKLCQIVVIR